MAGYLSHMYTYNINPQCCQLVEASNVHVRVMPQTVCIRPWRSEVDSSCLFKSKNKPWAKEGLQRLQPYSSLLKHLRPGRLKKSTRYPMKVMAWSVPLLCYLFFECFSNCLPSLLHVGLSLLKGMSLPIPTYQFWSEINSHLCLCLCVFMSRSEA